MGSFSIWHWLIVLAIVVMVFGTRRLSSAGGDLGAAVRNFRNSMKEGETESARRREQLAQGDTHAPGRDLSSLPQKEV